MLVCVCLHIGDADPAAGTRLSFATRREGVPVHDGAASKRCDGFSDVAYRIRIVE